MPVDVNSIYTGIIDWELSKQPMPKILTNVRFKFFTNAQPSKLKIH